MNKHIDIIGIGMNGKGTLTSTALDCIKNADLLIGAKRMMDAFSDSNIPVFTSHDNVEIASYIHNCEYNRIAVLMSGDSGFYSGTEKLLSLINDCEVNVLCGISTPSYFSSKIGISWTDWRFISLHGTDANIVRNVCSHEKTFFLLGGNVTASDICGLLCEYGLSETQIYIGENLGYENEKVFQGKATDFTDFETYNLCVMLVVNSCCERGLKSCINDSEFERGNVPMTKSEVRCVCTAKLGIERNSVCWDIGCGTGSMSVEMALRCTDGRVWAVDRKDEAVSLTDRNRHKFGCDNIIPLLDDAENAVKELPFPDCVFIGGSGGKADIIIQAALSKNPKARIVMTAISLETLEKSRAVFDRMNIPVEITQIAVTHTKKIGTHTMLSAENPVFILRNAAK